MELDLISKHNLRDAVRLGLQSAIAAALMYGLMEAFDLPEKFVGVLSAVLVIEKSIGESLGSSGQRFLATIVGCIIGAICLYLMPDGYGLIAGLAISMFVMNAVAAVKPAWRYGVVAAVAMSINPLENTFEVALDRTIAIGLGVVIGSLSALIIWPDKASTRAKRHLKISWSIISQYLELAVQSTVGHTQKRDNEKLESLENDYSTHISHARTLAFEMKFSDKKDIHEAIESTEKLNRCARMILTISTSTDELHDESQKSKELIENVKDSLISITDELSNDTSISEETLNDLRSAIEKLSDSFKENKEDDKSKQQQSAFLFIINETYENIQNLNSVVTD